MLIGVCWGFGSICMYDSSVKYTWQYISSTVRLGSVMLEEEYSCDGVQGAHE